jgi:hypothetical protein
VKAEQEFKLTHATALHNGELDKLILPQPGAAEKPPRSPVVSPEGRCAR